MTIEFFGWVNKPHILMTGLDTLIMVSELLISVGIGMAFGYLIEYKNRKRFKR